MVFGSSTAGGAYTPGLSDVTVLVKNQARVFLAGPPLVKAATGEEVDGETLGGAEMHSKVSGIYPTRQDQLIPVGVSDYLAQDEEHALYICRQSVALLNHQKEEPFPAGYLKTFVEPPIYDSGIYQRSYISNFPRRDIGNCWC